MATLATAYSHHHLSQHQQLMHNGTSSSGTISLDGGAVAEQAAADEEYIATFFGKRCSAVRPRWRPQAHHWAQYVPCTTISPRTPALYPSKRRIS